MTMNVDGFNQAKKLLAHIPGGIETALYRSLNRAMTEGRTVAIDSVTDEYTLKERDVRGTFSIKRASRRNPQANLTSRGGSVLLSQYAHRPKTDTTGKKRREVKVAVRKGAMKPLDRGFIHEGLVLQREGRLRYPIRVGYGPAVPVALTNEDVSEDVLETMQASVVKRLEHETLRLLSR